MPYCKEEELETIYHYQAKDKCTMTCAPEKSARIT